MSLNLRTVLTSFSFCALLGSSAANGETVLKLSLGNTGSDLAMDASGVLGTTSDGDAGTTGDQNTAIDYTGFLDPLFADVTTVLPRSLSPGCKGPATRTLSAARSSFKTSLAARSTSIVRQTVYC